MNCLKWIAAALAMLALGGCVGVIFPIPVSDSGTQNDNRNERR
jgi:hypothetical protein